MPMPNSYDNSSYNQQDQQQPPKTIEDGRRSYERRLADRRKHENCKAKQRDAELYLSSMLVENQEINQLKNMRGTTSTSVSAYHQTVKTHANWQISGTHHIKTL